MSNSEWNYCSMHPDDDPGRPVGWFRMDRERRMLDFNQTWSCRSESGCQHRFRGLGSLNVQLECSAGPENYTTGGCVVCMDGVSVQGSIVETNTTLDTP